MTYDASYGAARDSSLPEIVFPRRYWDVPATGGVAPGVLFR